MAAPDVRITVYNTLMTSVLALDASGDVGPGGITYEDTPYGCGAGSISLGLHYEDVIAKGYWGLLNEVEISTGDSVMTAACAAGATKIYVDSTAPFNASAGEDAQVAYFYDGVNLCMRVPVTGIGSDGGGPYITIGTPIAGGGNFTSLPAYGIGTIVGRRRYLGRIMRRLRYNTREPKFGLRLVGLSDLFNRAYDNFVISYTASVDVGTAIYQALQQMASRWPFFTISSSNFPTTGNIYSGSLQAESIAEFVQDAMTAILTGDLWALRVGHDLTPKLVKLFTQSSDTYTYTLTLPQGVTNYEPLNVTIQDDATNLFNSIEVIGNTDPTTKLPTSAIVQSTLSITEYGQLDGAPVTNLKAQTNAQCLTNATSLIAQNAAGQQSNQFRVYGRNDTTPVNTPNGFLRGDVVRGVDCVTLTRFDAINSVSNALPDSGFQYVNGVGSTLLWNQSGATPTVVTNPYGGGDNAIKYTAAGYVGSQPIDVVPGQVWTLQGVMDARNASGGGSMQIEVMNAAAYGTPAATLTCAAGSEVTSGSVTFTIPSGWSQMAIVFTTGTITTFGAGVFFAQGQVQPGSVATSYVVNNAAPQIFGLVSSVVTTIQPGKDQWQDVIFAAIEPDYNAVMAEIANGVATAAQINTSTSVGLDQYFVSPSAQSFTTSGLVVTVPTFEAVFALGSQPVACGGNTFTLTANATSFVWLNPNNTWSIYTSPTHVTGSIPYGMFTTNATGVIGSTFLASIGLLQAPLSYMINNVAYTPTFTTAGPTNAIPGNLTSQVSVSFTVTNQPTNGSYSKMVYYYRQYGQPVWLQLGTSPPLNSSGVATPVNAPVATGTYTCTVPDATNGITLEFGFAMESGATSETAIQSLGAIEPTSSGGTPITVPATSVTGISNVNFISDSNMDYTATNGASAYWSYAGFDSTRFHVNGYGGSAKYELVADAHGGAAVGPCCAYSTQIYVQSGFSYTLTVSTEKTSSGGTINSGIVSVADKTANNTTPTTIYASMAATTSGNPPVAQSITWVSTITGYVVVALWVTAGLNGSGAWTQPQFEYGTAFSGYKPGAAVTSENTVSTQSLDLNTQTVLSAAQAPSDQGTPVSLNSGFEAAATAGSGDIAAGWYVQANSLAGVLALTSYAPAVSTFAGNAYAGSNYLAFGPAASTTINASASGYTAVFARQPITVRVGEVWRLRMFSKIVGTVPSGVSYYVGVNCNLDLSDGTTQTLAGPQVSALTTSYEEYAVQFTIPTPSGGQTITGATIYVIFSLTNSNTSATTFNFAPLVDSIGFWKSLTASDLSGGTATDTGALLSGSTLIVTRHAPSIQSLQQSNALRNGRFLTSSVSYAWKPYSTGTLTSAGTYTYAGTTVGVAAIVTGTGTEGGAYQTITVKPGTTYSYSCLLYASNASLARIWIGSVGFATQYNTSPGTILGTTPAIANGSTSGSAPFASAYVDPINVQANGRWELVCGTITIPNGVTQIEFLIDCYPNSGGVANLFWYAPMFWEGTKWQDYNDGGVANSNGFIDQSTPFNLQGSLLNVANTPVYSYSSTPTTVTITVPASTYTMTDNVTTLSIGAGSFPFGGLAASTTYYVDVAVNIATSAYTCTAPQTTKRTSAQMLADCFADGKIAIYANYPFTTPASGTGGGSAGGGGGGGAFCPADYELVETRERGMIRADEVDIGMHLRGPIEGPEWVRVNDAVRGPTTLWRFTVAAPDGTIESFDVNDGHLCMRPDGEWLAVVDMRPGDTLKGRGAPLAIVSTECLGDGYYVGFDVDTHCFSMGNTCAHNMTTP